MKAGQRAGCWADLMAAYLAAQMAARTAAWMVELLALLKVDKKVGPMAAQTVVTRAAK